MCHWRNVGGGGEMVGMWQVRDDEAAAKATYQETGIAVAKLP